jgi:hypothetical protein
VGSSEGGVRTVALSWFTAPRDRGSTLAGVLGGVPTELQASSRRAVSSASGNGVKRAYYSDSIADFLLRSEDEILGRLAMGDGFALESTQRDAWREQIRILRAAFTDQPHRGKLYFEYSVPRLGRRIDVLAVIRHVIFVFEFKVGEREFSSAARDQVWDYALDLKNFHETSHGATIAPVLIATAAVAVPCVVAATAQADGVLLPVDVTPDDLPRVIDEVLRFVAAPAIDIERWEGGRYCPTPTIIEAAMALYSGHAVEEISRSDASAINLAGTSEAISAIIEDARAHHRKSICFVTGVPGAGKTLVGLNIATEHFDKSNELYSVFLSGNGPLVAILREALTRDKVRRAKARGERLKKVEAASEVKLFIQNVHHFRDECLVDVERPPVEHVALFDEAQRAWNREQTSSFMRRKKGRPGFDQSEPEFLISCLDRHRDWAVIVCLVGGGQEINTGEAGIGEWIDSVLRSFPQWQIHLSSRLQDAEYGAGSVLRQLEGRAGTVIHDELHLSVSMRSFRAEHVSSLVKQILDLEEAQARETFRQLSDRYPIVITRDVAKAKRWVRERARGSERYGMVVSSQAQRLKPHAIDVRSPMDPIHWFLDGKDDVRSSYYLEDVATEFHVQGLELDWACVTWDADFRFAQNGWEHWSFCGDRWNRVRKTERQKYLKNAYRVLLTRARQGMVVVVPEGDNSDPTRDRDFYDPTFQYLADVGIPVI